jgi:hypothetical protein
MTACGRETQTHHSSEEEQNRPSFRHVFLDARFHFLFLKLSYISYGDESKASENIFTHAELPENVEAAQRAGEAMEKAMNSGSLTAFQEKGPLGGVQEAPCSLTT